MNRHPTLPGSLERALQIAASAHAGQTDKGGAPYILHPLRVMAGLNDPVARMAAVLHDVVEDGKGWTLGRLAEEGFSQTVLDAVDAVTKRAGEQAPGGAPHEVKQETYLRFVRRAAAHPIGRLVKRADLQDNLDAGRLPHPLTEEDEARLARYRAALALLQD